MASTRTSQPSDAALHRLPARLLELVLQRLSLAEQLSHCTHLCKLCPPPTAVSLRHSTVLLNDDTVWHIAQSPRLLALLSTATSVALHVDTVLATSRALRFVLSAPTGDTLFPQLAHFSFRLSALASADAAGRRNGLADEALSMLPLLPFLSARSATLRSLHIDQCLHRIRYEETLAAELFPLLASFTALQRLHLAGMALWADNLPFLLSLPLEALDLSTSTVNVLNHDGEPLPTGSVADCALLRSCRILRLPRVLYLPTPWLEYLEAVLAARADSERPHTLAVGHVLSDAAAQKLTDMPPSRSLSLHSDTVDVEENAFLSRAAASPHLDDKPRQISLAFGCENWRTRSNMQPFVRFVASHHARIRSIKLTKLSQLPFVTSTALATALRCTNLRSLCLSAKERRNQATAGYDLDAQWADLPRLEHLHFLQLTGWRGDQVSLSWLFSVCPALRVCTLDVSDLSVAMLSALATSCPLLRHLQLLGITHQSELSLPMLASDGQPQTACPFRSLEQLDLHHVDWFQQKPSPLHKLHPFLVGSPLRRLDLVLQCEVGYGEAVTALVEAVPGLERLRIRNGHCKVLIDAPKGSGAWTDDADDEADEKLPPAPIGPLGPLPAATEQQPSSRLDSLDLLVSPTFLPANQLATVLSHCPAITSIHLTVGYKRDCLLHFLHCLAYVGLRCPLIERVTFHLDGAVDRPVWGMPLPEVCLKEVGAEAVRDVVDTFELPDGAFARLCSVRQVGDVREVLSDEAARYVRLQWLSKGRGTPITDWHTVPPPVCTPNEA